MSPHLLSGAARLAGSSLLRLQSDDRLVALVRDGHDPAFSAVVERYGPELLRAARRLVGAARAEDVVQQALVDAHRALTASEEPVGLRPWLHRIVHNAAVDVLRGSRDEAPLDERLTAPGGVEDDREARERLREAFKAIGRLPEPQRDALVLRAVQGRSHREIADALAVTPGAARQHVHRARATVRGAVSAVTPYGLLARFALGEASDPAGAALAGSGVGFGASALKVGAGVLAAGALATGATQAPLGGHQEQDRAAIHHAAGSAAGASPVLAAEPRDDRAASGHGSRHASRHSADHLGRSGGPGDGRGRSSGSGSAESGSSQSGSGPSGSGDGGSRSGSSGSDDGAQPVAATGDDHSGGSGSSSSGTTDEALSGDSGSGSSGSGQQGGGSDDGLSGGGSDD